MKKEQIGTKIASQDTEWLKSKLQNVLTLGKFCGLCLDSGDSLSSVEVELVIGKQPFSKNLQDLINYIFNDDVENFMSSLMLCDKCVEKIIQAYIFIHNSKQLSIVMNNCVLDLQSKVVDLNNQLDGDIDYENANIMIILENDKELCESIINTDHTTTEIVPTAIPKVNSLAKPQAPQTNIKALKEELALNKDIKHSVKEEKYIVNVKTPNITLKKGKLLVKPLNSSADTTPRYNTYKCADCSEIFTSYRILKEHEKAKHKTTVFHCQICKKSYNSAQYLNIHYKTHEVESCKICREILPERNIMNHLKTVHANSVYPCKVCDLVYYSKESLEAHAKASHKVNTTMGLFQCKMCFKKCNEVEFKEHRCKFSCPECPISTPHIPCLHTRFLKSFRDQMLSRINKVKCIDCDYTTRRKEHLIGHANREHLNHHPFTCADCGQQFYTKLSLKTHLVQFHEDLCCTYCDFQFKDKKVLENHTKMCKLVKRAFPCHLCKASFDLENEFERHQKLKHDEEVNACNLCKCKFLTKVDLEEHHARVHGGIQCKKRRRHIECTLCNIFFNNLKEMAAHEELHDPNEIYPCKLCPKRFSKLSNLYLHNQKHYSVRVKCQGCSRTMAASYLSQHVAKCRYKDKTDLSYVCQVCGKSYHLESLLRAHQIVHIPPQPCPLCNKILKPVSLRRHMESAHPDPSQIKKARNPRKVIKCKICNHVVQKNIDLEAHMNRFHLKIKPYVCSVCKKAFCGKARLKEHEATHSDVNTCFCQICNKKFANRVCLKIHFRMHTGESPYECDICGSKFRSSSMMKTHRLKKHLDKTVSCPLCNNKFYIARDMRYHFKKTHWKDKTRPFNPRLVPELSKEFYHLFEDRRLPQL